MHGVMRPRDWCIITFSQQFHVPYYTLAWSLWCCFVLTDTSVDGHQNDWSGGGNLLTHSEMRREDRPLFTLFKICFQKINICHQTSTGQPPNMQLMWAGLSLLLTWKADWAWRRSICLLPSPRWRWRRLQWIRWRWGQEPARGQSGGSGRRSSSCVVWNSAMLLG